MAGKGAEHVLQVPVHLDSTTRLRSLQLPLKTAVWCRKGVEVTALERPVPKFLQQYSHLLEKGDKKRPRPVLHSDGSDDDEQDEDAVRHPSGAACRPGDLCAVSEQIALRSTTTSALTSQSACRLSSAQERAAWHRRGHAWPHAPVWCHRSSRAQCTVA